MGTYLIITAAALACGMIILLIRSPGVSKKFIAGAATGFAALAAIDLTSSFTGIFLAVSGWSIAISAVLGLPGVVSMLLLKIIWKV